MTDVIVRGNAIAPGRVPVAKLPVRLDVGAAMGLVEIIWAAQAWARSYAPGAAALCSCSDVDGRRAAVVVTAPAYQDS